MKLKVTIGCSICSFKNSYKVDLPFECDTMVCPHCRNDNTLSIIMVHDEPSIFSRQDVQKRLERMRELNAT